ncbi:MAG: GDP-mannose 4,6-dehydratase, partial [Elusimicrobia bacterium]|nr:GDP-mannose 4,6-dehydratase [Elusimicrobiota bacterium]
ALERGEAGAIYNVGTGEERTNLEVVRRLCDLVGEMEGLAPVSLRGRIQFVPDRPGHDRRYALDCSKLRGLGWRPETDFRRALADTIGWYRTHEAWWRPLKRRLSYRSYYRKQYSRG